MHTRHDRLRLVLSQRVATISLAATLLCGATTARALDIQFDYSLDANNFFVGHPERQAVLEAAAQVFESSLTDVLTAITPGGTNTWTAVFDNPATGATTNLSNLTIATGVVRVYAGGRDLGTSTLGIGEVGGGSSSGTSAFVQTVAARGQAGGLLTPPIDLGPWGGSITFDIDSAWYFDSDVTTTENMAGLNDFYSVGVHELSHLLGFGTAPSWDTFVSGNKFTGAKSTALNGGVQLTLSADQGHWTEGTLSSVTTPVIRASQEAAMDPSILIGTRKYFTTLDYAGLDDIGWDVVPEPAGLVLLAMGSVLLGARRVRRAVIAEYLRDGAEGG